MHNVILYFTTFAEHANPIPSVPSDRVVVSYNHRNHPTLLYIGKSRRNEFDMGEVLSNVANWLIKAAAAGSVLIEIPLKNMYNV